MTTPTLRLELADVAALRQELATNLRAGGCFVHGASGWTQNDPCLLEIVHPVDGASLRLPAQVVWIADEPARQGVGVTFLDFSSERREEIARFIEEHAEPSELPELDAAAEASEPSAGAVAEASEQGDASFEARHERLRGLSSTEQAKVALRGDASDRIVLERIYGKAVWAALIANPRLTPPEVARLARMGNLPRPQLEQIVANASWLQSPQVRRALLTNPRLSQEQILKVLRLLPPHELKQVPAQTTYPQLVRSSARRVLRG